MPINNVKRKDLIVRYQHKFPPKTSYDNISSVSGMISQSMPMAAMFLRNKFIAWFAFIQTFYSALTSGSGLFEMSIPTNETAKNVKSGSLGTTSQPNGVKFVMSLIGVLFCYSDLVIPQKVPGWVPKADSDIQAGTISTEPVQE
ncbi:hypothetical protein TBLA_0A06600 [Henningerozyma blattae CBS 6284]|uniref:Uncharacterized protein n=1 Tax=Henningerozyma blattae (strain ATCC 34711 / CBS 6284 / DSM 70876 / NBRC 10599 / NRRL Y-10934 / UCD 77-7) TaxID=1071380 RepID=I2GWF0_HENB6|nr:hypothetical protein TBLA_0A06600 [Tetrapisispora blattae CBS 6284]CCH58452.1 hypothetical protein TBLA_0A06600 [Tetrapisispora blattae CBS 6284]